jgi:hypothetical protein
MSNLKQNLEIPADKLQYRLDEQECGGAVFEEIEPCCGIIGQDRALSAVELGLEIKSKGYNIFVTGTPGTGRTTAVKLLLEQAQKRDEKPSLRDVGVVNNFRMAESPRVLYFPAGVGRKFRKAISYLIDSLKTVIHKIFSGENYRERRDRIIKEFETRQKELFKEFERKLKERGFIHYEISNFAKSGQECIHNLNYWRGGEYVGLGAAAASHINGRRFRNRSDLAAYLGEPTCQTEDNEMLRQRSLQRR